MSESKNSDGKLEVGAGSFPGAEDFDGHHLAFDEWLSRAADPLADRILDFPASLHLTDHAQPLARVVSCLQRPSSGGVSEEKGIAEMPHGHALQ